MLCKHMESSQHWNKFPRLEPIFSKKEAKLKSSVSFYELSIQSKGKYKRLAFTSPSHALNTKSNNVYLNPLTNENNMIYIKAQKRWLGIGWSCRSPCISLWVSSPSWAPPLHLLGKMKARHFKGSVGKCSGFLPRDLSNLMKFVSKAPSH